MIKELSKDPNLKHESWDRFSFVKSISNENHIKLGILVIVHIHHFHHHNNQEKLIRN